MALPHPLAAPLERQLRAFGGHLPAAVDGEVEPVHQCRVATRRLREILPLCAAEVPRATAERARRRVRRVGRALGPVREIDVSIGVAEELTQRQFVQGAAAEHLRQHLLDEREERREQMLDRLRSINTRKLERDLAEVARALGLRQQTDAWAQTLAARMARRARNLRDAIAAAGSLYIADRVHAVRIAAKQLRYALEFAGETGEARTKGAVRQVKAVQETLGRLNDLDVLAGLVQDFVVPGDPQPWHAELEALRVRVEGECRKLHGRYVAKQAALLETCDTAAAVARRILAERGGEPLSGRRARSAGQAPGGRALKMALADPPPAEREASGGGQG